MFNLKSLCAENINVFCQYFTLLLLLHFVTLLSSPLLTEDLLQIFALGNPIPFTIFQDICYLPYLLPFHFKSRQNIWLKQQGVYPTSIRLSFLSQTPEHAVRVFVFLIQNIITITTRTFHENDLCY